jgi:hypothetical protein
MTFLRIVIPPHRLFEHDLRANRLRLPRRKTSTHFSGSRVSLQDQSAIFPSLEKILACRANYAPLPLPISNNFTAASIRSTFAWAGSSISADTYVPLMSNAS